MLLRTARRLPGFRFEAPQSPPDVLPRMDVAVFVGFAASGPLNRPVPVEDAAQFAEIFGDDVPLAWDAIHGETVYAYLAPAVRAFFRNGGRRCWVVRVAGPAQTNSFPIPGLARVQFDEDNQIAGFRPTFARARSEGSWSDSVRVGAVLASQPFEVEAVDLNHMTAGLTTASQQPVAEGDLLRLIYRDVEGDKYVVMFAVKLVKPVEDITSPHSSPFSLPAVPAPVSDVKGRTSLKHTRRLLAHDPLIWLQPGWRRRPPSSTAEVIIFTSSFEQQSISATVPFRFSTGSASPPVSELDWPTSEAEPLIKLDLNLSSAEAPLPESLLQIDFGTESLWMRVQELDVAGEEESSPPHRRVRVKGHGFWLLKHNPFLESPLSEFSQQTVTVERLTFELLAQPGHQQPMRLKDLGFLSEHPRYWAALPTDRELFPSPVQPARNDSRHDTLCREAASPRFPLAGEISRHEVTDPFSLATQEKTETISFFCPLDMPGFTQPESFVGPERDPFGQSTLERNGLAQFDAGLFLNPHLAETNLETLIPTADYLRYQLDPPQELSGVFAALEVEEATLIVAPDCVHPSWEREDAPPPELLSEFSPTEVEADCAPPPGEFIDCDVLATLEPPFLRIPDDIGLAGTFTLEWARSPSSPPGLAAFDMGIFILEEASQPDFANAEEVYRGRDWSWRVYGRAPGEYYYRVRVGVGSQTSRWSLGIEVCVPRQFGWRLRPFHQYVDTTLLAVHRALLRLCAARGDLLAILALPEHYREAEAIEHVRRLKSPYERGSEAALPPKTGWSLPLSKGESLALSFGAVYHPWLIGRDELNPATFRRTPPVGAVCGLMAQRARARGAWVAPANQPFDQVIKLIPSIRPERRQELQDIHINLIRQEPRGFLVLDADTLSDDPDLRLINVRRLLSLLRRLALRLGTTYVFEPHDEAFRRQVQRGFEVLLERLFAQGAFAGRVATQAFQVVADESLNPPQSVEQGRFIVELKVAPSLPLHFLTLRLVQTYDGVALRETT